VLPLEGVRGRREAAAARGRALPHRVVESRHHVDVMAQVNDELYQLQSWPRKRIERFLAFVKIGSKQDCWLWIGSGSVQEQLPGMGDIATEKTEN
jgi:hypothetical protein